jgi:divalent metal cation (Fe/Co/Zn/Cd) transporter
MSTPVVCATTPPLPSTDAERPKLITRAKRLATLGLAWHAVEATVAVVAGRAADSVALIGFGIDSVIEAAAGFIVLWRFREGAATSQTVERRAQQAIAVSFFVLAGYVAVESVRALINADRPETSVIGIALAAATLVTMPPLARAKARVGAALRSHATVAEGRQNILCAYLSGVLLVGLLANALAGAWWLDSVAALVIGALAVKEGIEAWQGEECESCGC